MVRPAWAWPCGDGLRMRLSGTPSGALWAPPLLQAAIREPPRSRCRLRLRRGTPDGGTAFRQARARDPRQRRCGSASGGAICRTSLPAAARRRAARAPGRDSVPEFHFDGQATAAAPAHATSRCRPIGPWWRRSPGRTITVVPTAWAPSVDFLAPGNRLPGLCQHDRRIGTPVTLTHTRTPARPRGRGALQRRQRQRVQSGALREPEVWASFDRKTRPPVSNLHDIAPPDTAG